MTTQDPREQEPSASLLLLTMLLALLAGLVSGGLLLALVLGAAPQ